MPWGRVWNLSHTSFNTVSILHTDACKQNLMQCWSLKHAQANAIRSQKIHIMLTVNHITVLISINWITGSKQNHLNWFFSKGTWQENVNAWIFLHASLKQDWLLTKGDSGAELILARGCLQVSVLHKNLYRILKQQHSARQLQLKADTRPLCAGFGSMPTNASLACSKSLQSMVEHKTLAGRLAGG